MQFRLVYEGLLLGQNGDAAHKWHIRKAFYPQLEKLWQQEPLASASSSLLVFPPMPAKVSNIRPRGIVQFAPLVTAELKLFAEVSVLLFRPRPKGSLLGAKGDADNQLKTLLDALRMPSPNQEIKQAISANLSNPFYCLLEDDSLVTKVCLETEQWLASKDPNQCLAIIDVVIKKSVVTYANMGF